MRCAKECSALVARLRVERSVGEREHGASDACVVEQRSGGVRERLLLRGQRGDVWRRHSGVARESKLHKRKHFSGHCTHAALERSQLLDVRARAAVSFQLLQRGEDECAHRASHRCSVSCMVGVGVAWSASVGVGATRILLCQGIRFSFFRVLLSSHNRPGREG